MRTRLSLALALCLGLASTLHAEGPALETEEQRVLYAVGLALSQNITAFGFDEKELVFIQAGIADGALGRDHRVPLNDFGPKIQPLLQARVAAQSEKEKADGNTYRAEAGKEPGAVVLESGLIYRELEAGSGASPSATDTVKLHYHGTLRDGTVFDSSRDRGTPATFGLNQVVPCFSQGLMQMKVGGKAKIVCPPDLAYADRGSPPNILPGATIIFELELLEIVTQPGAPTP
jgi:FKBP-type peptidyl-prolyl cis-trans isomerase